MIQILPKKNGPLCCQKPNLEERENAFAKKEGEKLERKGGKTTWHFPKPKRGQKRRHPHGGRENQKGKKVLKEKKEESLKKGWGGTSRVLAGLRGGLLNVEV